MRIRVFTAPRMAEAMAMVRSELGADAVILNSRRTAGGVEVTAALEAPEPAAPAVPPPVAAAPPPAPPAGVLARHGVPPKLAARLEGGPLSALLAQALAFRPLPDGVGRPLLLAGHVSSRPRVMAASSRWRARRAGCCGLQPSA